MKSYQIILVPLFLVLAFQLKAQKEAIYDATSIHHPLLSKNGMVSTQHMEATKVGLEILEQGGNAVDAAVAVGFSLAVVLPRAGNLGGGGFMLYHDNARNKTTAYNYREMAPAKAHRDMYLDADGNVDVQLARMHHQASGVPGTVAGLLKALEDHGNMTVEQVVAPAIRLAEEGFPITFDLARLLKLYESRLRASSETEKIFYPSKTTYYEAGDTLRQLDLAWSLKQISKRGRDGFYKGELAKRIAKDMSANDGLIKRRDLAKYKVEVMEPVTGTYRGHEIISMPPPSSGGIHLIQMLNILEEFPIEEMGHNTGATIHTMAEAMKYAYADRSEHLGDPNFYDVPVEWITSKTYGKELSEKISTESATASEDISPGKPNDNESDETTHFSVIDKNRNVVSQTYTLNFSFGNGIVAKGTGILLNNEMNDFSAKPGVPNAFGLLGGEANSIQPGKRPLSSMTPTIVLKDGEPYFVTGTPGGSRIITTILQVVMNIIDHKMNVAEATHASRIHHQWYPEDLFIEGKGISMDTQKILGSMGHSVKIRSVMGSTQTIMILDELLRGCSDPRRPDARIAGY
ncbi:MAG: gamma-glutamyltransferase [Bacteroidia bacterium]|nr:gamma-glutamyltransferase [Bacteroidia bacterium]